MLQPAQRAGLAGRLQEGERGLLVVAILFGRRVRRCGPARRTEDRGGVRSRSGVRHLLDGRPLQVVACHLESVQQRLDPLTQGGIAGASLVEEGRALGGTWLFQGGGEQRLVVHGSGSSPACQGLLPCSAKSRTETDHPECEFSASAEKPATA